MLKSFVNHQIRSQKYKQNLFNQKAKKVLYHKWTKWDISVKKHHNKTLDKSQDIILAIMNSNKANIFNSAFISDLNGCLDVIKLKEFPEEAPLVLTSNGHTFSGGIDMNEIMQMDQQDIREFLTNLNNALEKLYTVGRMTCAIINGHAIGPGLCLALACDFRVLALENNKTQISMKDIQLGIPLTSICMEIARSQIPRPDPLYEAIFTGRNYKPEEAFSRSIVSDACELTADLLNFSLDIVTQTDNKSCLKPFQQMKKTLKEPGIAAMRESGEAKKLDEDFIAQVRNEDVKKVVMESISHHQSSESKKK